MSFLENAHDSYQENIILGVKKNVDPEKHDTEQRTLELMMHHW